MVKLNRHLEIQFLYLKGRIKRSPFCPPALVRAWWEGKSIINRVKNNLGYYPATNDDDASYYKLTKEQLTNEITTSLDAPHAIGQSCIASELDFTTPEFKSLFLELREPVGQMERKSWEFVMLILGLKKFGCLSENKIGVGIGSGCEKPLYFLARHCQKIIGTDLYESDTVWQHTAHSDVMKNPHKYAPFSYPRERLELRHMNALDLKFDDNCVDFVFSVSAIEHFGSRENIRKTMSEIGRVLKPGGYAAITTELIINTGAKHPEYFTPQELSDNMIKASNMELVAPLNLQLTEDDINHVIDFDVSLNKNKRIIFKHGNVIFTPVLLFFRKPL